MLKRRDFSDDSGPIFLPKGYILCRIEHVSRKVPERNSRGFSNRGWNNVCKNPTRLRWLQHYYFPNPFPSSVSSWSTYLQNQVGDGKYRDGEYSLLVWSGQKRRKFWKWGIKWGKRQKFWKWVRPWRGFARFSIEGGRVSIRKYHQQNCKGKWYLIWALPENDSVNSLTTLPSRHMITLEDLGRK